MDWTHPSAGGAETYLKEVLFRLTKSHKITLFCSKGESLPDEEIINGIRIIRCGVRTDNVPYINQTFIAYRYYREQVSDDVLLVNGASQLYPLFRSKNRIDIYHLFSGRDSLDGELKGKIKFGFEWVAIRLSKGRQIAVSQNQKEKIEHETPRSVHRVVNGGVDIEKFSGDVEKFERPTMLHLGRLGKQKGTDKAIEIHREIQDRMEIGVDFHICGTGGMSELAEEYAVESPTVTYHGHVSEAKKVKLMQKSWLKLVPSRSESFGLVVIEANAAGTPVVASDIAGLSDTVENGVNGFRVTEGNMIESCVEILENNEYREELRRSARQYAQRYSWDRTLDGIQTTINNLH
jgi:glycosyltransferase involved in cell wall biosynthesis